MYICGNGGSAADSDHIAGELLKAFLLSRPLSRQHRDALHRVTESPADCSYLADRLQEGLRAVSLTGHPACSTAVANDLAADLAFAQQLLALARSGDVLLAISTSGMARNVSFAAHVARAIGVSVIGLTGRSGGNLTALSDVAIRVPADRTHEIQELHVPVYHALCAMLESAFFE